MPSIPEKTFFKYPDKFFEPLNLQLPTIHNVLAWCEFFTLTDSFVNSIITKLATYVITNIVTEPKDTPTSRKLIDLFEKINIYELLAQFNFTLLTYGNAFVSILKSFNRQLQCTKCGQTYKINAVKQLSIQNYQIVGRCNNCNLRRTFKVIDTPVDDVEEVIIKFWEPKNIIIDSDVLTNKHRYIYVIPKEIRDKIKKIERTPTRYVPEVAHYEEAQKFLSTLPTEFLTALKAQKALVFSPHDIFHARRPGYYPLWNSAWGIPLAFPVLRDLYTYYLLRQIQDYLVRERGMPLRFIFPQQAPQVASIIDVAKFNKMIVEAFRAWEETGEERIRGIPVPIGYQTVGGEGLGFNLEELLSMMQRRIAIGMQVPLEFVFGGLTWCVNPDTYIFTNKGMLQLKDLKAGDFTNIATHNGHAPIKYVHFPGNKEQLRIKTKLGIDLQCSPDHHIFVIKNNSIVEKRAAEIKYGDYVAIKAADIWSDTIPQINFADSNEKVSFPRELSLELARLLGYVISKGEIIKGKIICKFSKRKHVKDFVKCCNKIFNYHPLQKMYQLELEPPISEFLIYLCGNLNPETKQVPTVIKRAPKEFVIEFLDALLAESKKRSSVIYRTKSKILAKEIQLLLLNAGIISYLHSGRIYKLQIKNKLRPRNNSKLTKKYIKAKVIDVSKEPSVEMMDLTVLRDHTYIANGIITHNSGSNVSLRMLENNLRFLINADNLFLNYIKNRIADLYELPDLKEINLRLASIRMADDIARQRLLIELLEKDLVSEVTVLQELGLDFEKESENIEKGIKKRGHRMKLNMIEQAKAQREAQKELAKLELEVQRMQQAMLKAVGITWQEFTQLPPEYQMLVQRLITLPPPERNAMIDFLKRNAPVLMRTLEKIIRKLETAMESPPEVPPQEAPSPSVPTEGTPAEAPLPEKLPPRRTEKPV